MVQIETTKEQKRCNNGMCNKPLESDYPWISCKECLKRIESKPENYTICPKCGNRGVYDYGDYDGTGNRADGLFWIECLSCSYCDYVDWDPSTY